MPSYSHDQAVAAVRRAAAGHGTAADAVLLVDLFRRATVRRGTPQPGIEAEANALAAVLADIIDGDAPAAVIQDLPRAARRRVLAYRHQKSPIGRYTARDSYGVPLPVVPAREVVMRESTVVLDEDGHRSFGGREIRDVRASEDRL